MARMVKQGLDYFPLDVNLDDKIDLIEAKYGLVGYAILVKLWQKIYANSYYILWTEERKLLFKKQINVDINLLNDVINDCFCWHLFDKCMYEKYQILTSKGIQERYCEAIQRRKEVDFFKEFLLVDVSQKLPKTINVNINSINVDINQKNDDINSQSKVKESKVKESKEEITRACAREEDFSPTQIKFHNAFPEKPVDGDLNKEQDVDKLIKSINQSEFLKSLNNLGLGWMKKNYEKVISGAFKDFHKKVDALKCMRTNYTQEEFNNLFSDLSMIEI